MKKYLTTLVIIIIGIGSLNGQTKTVKNIEQVHAQADSAVSLMIKGNFDDAFNMLKPYWPLDGYQIDGLKETTAKQFPMLEQSFGKMLGYQFVKSETLEGFGHAEHFLVKYEKNALRLYIIYYNNGSGWMLNSLQWDDRWDMYFDIRTKID